MKSMVKAAFLLSTVAASALVTPALAGELDGTAGGDAADGSDIIVTARRVEERLQDVPISMTVFSQEQLTNRNVTNAGELATYTPSLTANTRFGPENTTYAIRGFVQENNTSPSVGVYFADVVAPRANGSTAGGNGAAGPGAFFDLQSVQVLKGPQGTLFGRNTTGGAVLLVPQKPTSQLEGYIEGSIGNYNMRRVQAVVNVPLADTFRVRLGLDTQRRDGFLHNISSVGPRDFADVDYWAFRASIVGDLTPNLENYTIFSYGKSNTNGYLPKVYVAGTTTTSRIIQMIGSELADTNASGDYYAIKNSLSDPYNRSEQWQAINTTTWQASDTLTIKNIASYGEYRSATNNAIFGEYGAALGPTTIPASGTLPAVTLPALPAGYTYYAGTVLRAAPNGYNMAQGTFTEEFQIQGRTPNDRLNYQLGAYLEISNPLGWQHTFGANGLACQNVDLYQCMDVKAEDAALLRANGYPASGNPNSSTTAAGGGQIQDILTRYRFRNIGLYAQGTIKFTENLSLTAGFRYTIDKVTGDGRITRVAFPAKDTPRFSCGAAGLAPGILANTSNTPIDPALCNVNLTQKSSRPTWMIGLDYKPTDDILVYAKYSRGYRQGNINLSSAGYTLNSWGPEKVDAYEIGAKVSFDGAVRGYLNFAAFYNKFDGQQLALRLNGCSAIYNPALPQSATNNPNCTITQTSTAGISNAGASTIQGVEVDASISPFEGLRLDGSYAFLDTNLDSAGTLALPAGYLSVISTALVNQDLPLTPRHKFTISANYTLPLEESWGRMTVGATFSYQTETFNTATAASKLPSQKNLNLNVNWNSVHGLPVDLGLFVTNVTKEKFITNTTGTVSQFGWDAAVLNQPRMFGARIKVRFGN